MLGQGWGLFVTRNVEAGDVLLCERALGVFMGDQGQGDGLKQVLSLAFNPANRRINKRSQVCCSVSSQPQRLDESEVAPTQYATPSL
jgi:hypothetical protein